MYKKNNILQPNRVYPGNERLLQYLKIDVICHYQQSKEENQHNDINLRRKYFTEFNIYLYSKFSGNKKQK